MTHGSGVPTVPALLLASGSAIIQGLSYRDQHRKQRATEFAEEFGRHANLSADELKELIRDNDLFAELIERGLRSAADTSFRDKRRLLGRVVAAALSGTGFAAPDRYLLLVRSIDALEPVHVQVLLKMACPQPNDGALAGSPLEGFFITSDLIARWPEVNDVVRPVLAVLEREGLVDSAQLPDGRTHAWAPSPHGRLLLKHLSPDELTGLRLDAAAIAVRFEPQPSTAIVIRCLGPGDASDIKVRARPLRPGDPRGHDEWTAPWLTRAVFGIAQDAFDLQPLHERLLPTTPPNMAIFPPFEVRVEWTDGQGRTTHVYTAAPPRLGNPDGDTGRRWGDAGRQWRAPETLG